MLRAEEHILKTILVCILTAATLDDIKEEATPYLEQVATHFSLLLATQSQPSTEKLNVLINQLFFLSLCLFFWFLFSHAFFSTLL
jgi:hypothetical protein